MKYLIDSLFITSVSMSLIALINGIATRFLRAKYDIKWCYYTWLIIIVGFLIPVKPSIPILRNKIVIPFVSDFLSGKGVNSGIINHIVRHLDVGNRSQTTDSVYLMIAILWILGAIGLLGYHLVRHQYFLRMANRWSEELNDLRVLGIFKLIQNNLNIKKQVELCTCPCISSPMLIGFFKPKILLPTTMIPSDNLYFILKHELIHFKRKDIWYKNFVILSTAIHWFNPLSYIIAKEISELCENSCDAEVVKNIQNEGRLKYTETIVGIVKGQSRMKTAFSTDFYSSRNNLRKRIASIMKYERKKRGIPIVGIIILLTLTISCVFHVNNITPKGNANHGFIIKTTVKSENTIIDSNGSIIHNTDEKQYHFNSY